MKTFIAIIFLVQLFGVTASAQDTAEILNRWVEALGGAEQLEKISCIHRKASTSYGGMTGTSELWLNKDGNWRDESKLGSVSDTTTVFVSEGKAWYRDTNGSVREIQGTELQDLILEGYLLSFSHLLPGRMKGSAMTRCANFSAKPQNPLRSLWIETANKSRSS